MIRPLTRFTRWAGSRKRMEDVLVAERMARDLSKRLGRSVRELDRRDKQLGRLRRKLRTVDEKTEQALEEARSMASQYDEAIEALRSENRVYRDVTIPTLIASHKKILSRIDAETSIEVRRQVNAGGE